MAGTKRLSSMLTTTPTYNVVDSGPLSGERNMAIDRAALEEFQSSVSGTPVLRFFQWTEPTITYGYLLDLEKVKSWAANRGASSFAKRPTGGGAVLHSPSDLSLSLLWPRNSGLFSDTPRTCYAEIHSIILKTLLSCGTSEILNLHTAPKKCSDTPPLPPSQSASKNRFAMMSWKATKKLSVAP